MLKPIEEFGKYVEITGFRNVKITDAKAFAEVLSKKMPEGVEIQLFDADLVASWQHLYLATINALSAFKTNRNISKSIAVETVLYASAQRQIKKAIDQIGLKLQSKNAAVLVIGGDSNSVKVGVAVVSKWFGFDPDETVLQLSETKTRHIKKVFDISEIELEAVYSRKDSDQALIELIIERVSLLSTRL